MVATVVSTPLDLRIADLNKTFAARRGAGVHALQNVQLVVPAATFTAILGPSGCGKSTLLKVIAGLTGVTSGSCLLAGRQVVRPQANVSVVFQRPALLPWRNLVDNVALPLELRGMGRSERRDRARSLLSVVGLPGLDHRYPDELSGGMQQRVAIARALVSDPAVLLLDEPFGALDEQTRLMMGEELLRIWDARRSTIVFVTHSIQEAILLADQVAVMSRTPGTIREVFQVELPRPRTIAALTSPEGQALQEAIWRILKPESLAAMRGELRSAEH